MALALLAMPHFLMLGLHRTAERDVAISASSFSLCAIIDREKFLTTARQILRVNSARGVRLAVSRDKWLSLDGKHHAEKTRGLLFL